MKADKLNLMLVNKFPNLKEKYNEEISWQEGNFTGSHTIYGDVFTPYIVNSIQFNNKKELEKIFTYIEELLLLDNSYVEEVIMFSTLESLLYLLENNDEISQYLGKSTKNKIEVMTRGY